jgi:hypothetical protein
MIVATFISIQTVGRLVLLALVIIVLNTHAFHPSMASLFILIHAYLFL